MARILVFFGSGCTSSASKRLNVSGSPYTSLGRSRRRAARIARSISAFCKYTATLPGLFVKMRRLSTMISKVGSYISRSTIIFNVRSIRTETYFYNSFRVLRKISYLNKNVFTCCPGTRFRTTITSGHSFLISALQASYKFVYPIPVESVMAAM